MTLKIFLKLQSNPTFNAYMFSYFPLQHISKIITYLKHVCQFNQKFNYKFNFTCKEEKNSAAITNVTDFVYALINESTMTN